MKVLQRPCAVCNSTNGEILHHQQFILPKSSPLPEAYDIVSCDTCGFCYADTPMDQATYDKYYTEMSKYEDSSTATGGSATAFDRDRFADMATLFSDFITSSDSFIDIGCANGGMLDAMKNKAFTNLTGIDVAQKCVEYIASVGYQSFWGGLFNIEKLEGRKYKFIVLSHVLEHIKDIKLAVKNLDEICDDNGYIYIEVPNAAEYKSNFIVPFYYFDCEHINHFDKDSLKNLFGVLGYECVSVTEKVLFPSGDMPYPALGVVFQKVKKERSIEKSNRVKLSIEKHVLDSTEKYLFPQLQKVLDAQTPMIVWGAGQYTLRLMVGSPLAKCNILNFVDNDSNKHHSDIKGIFIESPKDILPKHPNSPIAVTSALHAKAIGENIAQIDGNSSREIIIL
jgi:SAM-dependent methyltransferase